MLTSVFQDLDTKTHDYTECCWIQIKVCKTYKNEISKYCHSFKSLTIQEFAVWNRVLSGTRWQVYTLRRPYSFAETHRSWKIMRFSWNEYIIFEELPVIMFRIFSICPEKNPKEHSGITTEVNKIWGYNVFQ